MNDDDIMKPILDKTRDVCGRIKFEESMDPKKRSDFFSRFEAYGFAREIMGMIELYRRVSGKDDLDEFYDRLKSASELFDEEARRNYKHF